jgi:glycosyltransferase involved in cell wall biosynthesis
MEYGPNEDAVVYFSNEVLPLKKEYPAVEFWIVGYGPGEKVCALSKHAGIYVTGTVEDIRLYIKDARVYVSPLRYGAGMKNKILTAMAMSRPVVATSISLEGIEVEHKKHVLVGDNPVDFAKQVIRVLKDKALEDCLTKNSLKVVKEKYSWRVKGQELEEALNQVKMSFA